MKTKFETTSKRYYQTTAVLFVLLTATLLPAQERDLTSIVKANFMAADEDGNEKLDSTEFRFLIDANAQSEIGQAAMVRRFNAYETAFKTADENGDGHVAWSEILARQAK